MPLFYRTTAVVIVMQCVRGRWVGLSCDLKSPPTFNVFHCRPTATVTQIFGIHSCIRIVQHVIPLLFHLPSDNVQRLFWSCHPHTKGETRTQWLQTQKILPGINQIRILDRIIPIMQSPSWMTLLTPNRRFTNQIWKGDTNLRFTNQI